MIVSRISTILNDTCGVMCQKIIGRKKARAVCMLGNEDASMRSIRL